MKKDGYDKYYVLCYNRYYVLCYDWYYFRITHVTNPSLRVTHVKTDITFYVTIDVTFHIT